MRYPFAFGLLLVPAAALAADGTLVVEVVTEDGRRCAADVEVRRAGGGTEKTLRALTGETQTPLAPGEYQVVCRARIGDLEGSKRVTVRSGETLRYQVRVAPKAPPPREPARAPAREPERERAAQAPPPAHGTLAGTVRKGKKGDQPADGTVRILITADVKDGAFEVPGLPHGWYTVEFVDKGKVRAQAKVHLEGDRKQVELRVR